MTSRNPQNRRKASSFASFPRCAFTLTRKVTVPASILFRHISMAAARISASGAPTNVAFPPSPIHLLTAFNNDWFHTNTATAPLSAFREAPEKTLLIQANLSWSHLPLVPLCTAAFSFFVLKLLYILLPFCPFCLNRHLLLLGPETHSFRSLCPSGNHVLSLSIAHDIRLFFLILWLLSSQLLFARLPHGNIGEPSARHTFRSLRMWSEDCFYYCS